MTQPDAIPVTAGAKEAVDLAMVGFYFLGSFA